MESNDQSELRMFDSVMIHYITVGLSMRDAANNAADAVRQRRRALDTLPPWGSGRMLNKVAVSESDINFSIWTHRRAMAKGFGESPEAHAAVIDRLEKARSEMEQEQTERGGG